MAITAPPSRRGRPIVIAVWVAVAAVALLGILYGLRVGWLWVMATEGDTPSSDAIRLPEGAEIVGEETDCGSGGCWVQLTVKPAAGESASSLAERLGATPRLDLPGNVFDPRPVHVTADAGPDTLRLQLDYWSRPVLP